MIILNLNFAGFAQCIPCGDASDGILLVKNDTTIAGAEYNFSSVTINAGRTLTISGDSSLRIRSTGKVTVAGTLSLNGTNGTNGVTFLSAGQAGIGVASGADGGNGYYHGSLVGSGQNGAGSGSGSGGASFSGGGGAGFSTIGTSSSGPGGTGGPAYGNTILIPGFGGSGGAGGGGGNGCGSGGGGGGGGYLLIASCDSIAVASTGIIRANGGNGGSDGGGNCGGGGGGSGGSIWLSGIHIRNLGSVTATGGAGGTATVIGDPGGAGSSGRIRRNYLTSSGSGTYQPLAQYSSTFPSLTVTATPVPCFGDSNGTAATNLINGIPPFTFSWSTGSTFDSISGLPSGNFPLTVTDSTGCNLSDTAFVMQPDSALSVSVSSQDISCFGDSSGWASIEVAGGWGGWQFLWTGGSTADSITGLISGNYSVTVTDSLGCMVQDSVFLNEPAPLGLTMSVSPATAADGKAIATASGGTPPFSYSWNTNPSQTTDTANNLIAGWYTVTVLDSNGCSISDSVEVLQIESVDGEFASRLKLFPNPADEFVFIEYDRPGGNFQSELAESSRGFKILSLDAKVMAEGRLQGGRRNSIDVSGLPPGVFTVQLQMEGNRAVLPLVIVR